MDLASIGIVLSKQLTTKVLIRLHRMRRLICAFVVRIWQKQVLSGMAQIRQREELELEIENFDPDVVVLTEIFPKSIDSTEILYQEFKIEGFNLLLGKVTEKCRGVCIYVKNGLTFYECKTLNDFSFNESCWCILRLDSHRQMLIGGIYEPCHEKTCFIPYANNKGTDQPAHPRSLISTFLFAA